MNEKFPYIGPQNRAQNELKLTNFNHLIKMPAITELMYKKLCKEHQILQRSFATVCKTLNEALCKSQGTTDNVSNLQQRKLHKKESEHLKRQLQLLSLQLQQAKDQNKLSELRIRELEQQKAKEVLNSLQPHVSSNSPDNDDHLKMTVSNSDIMYKKLVKEHQQLQRSFATVCHLLNETRSKSQGTIEHHLNCQQKKINKKESESLQRQIELLSFELQEARDQNELLEFRLHESEQIKGLTNNQVLEKSNCAIVETKSKEFDREKHFKIACLNCAELESQLRVAGNESQKLNERFNACQRALQHIIEKYKLKEDAQNLLGNCFRKINETYDSYKNKNVLLNNIFDVNTKLIRVVELDTGYIGSAMTSEDEGLGDDTRLRDDSSGPSSLADLQESEYDTRSEQSPQSPELLQLNEKRSDAHSDALFYKNDKCILSDTKIIEDRYGGERKQVSAQTENDELMRLQAYIEQLEQSIAKLKEEKASLEEQVLELEEAENDARLISQRLQQRVDSLLFQYETMQSDLIDTKKTIDFNNNKIKTLEKIEVELRAQIAEMRCVIIKHCAHYNTKNENLIATDESKKVLQHEEIMNKLTVLEKEGKNLHEQLHQVDRLYYFLWEKLYKLESQIDSYKHSKQCFIQHDSGSTSDDDLQLFIDEEKLSEAVSNIGSSFDVTKFDRSSGSSGSSGSNSSNSSSSSSRSSSDSQTPANHTNTTNCNANEKYEKFEKYELQSQQSNCVVYKHCNASTRLDDLVLSLPLCDTVKPERIDVQMMCSPKIRPSSPGSLCLPSEIMTRINKLETNEQQLKDRLTQLEWINKEFVRELELREQIFFEREKKHNQWVSSENELKETISQLNTQTNKLDIKLNSLDSERKQLIDEIVSQRNELEKTKLDNETELKNAQIEQNNVVINMQKHIDELEAKEREYIQKIECLECNAYGEQLKCMSENYAKLKDELQKEKQNIIKLKEDFATELSNLKNYHISHENELQNRIKDLESQKTNFTTKLQTLTEQQLLLKQLAVDKENELKKVRHNHEERIKILEEEHTLVEKELKMKMEEMENKSTTTVKELECERSAIQSQLEDAYNQMKSREFDYSQRIQQLSECVDKLESKLAKLIKTDNNVSLDKEKSTDVVEVKSEIPTNQWSEQELRTKLSEMMQKEAAYEETLSKADNIIASLENNYKQRIEELESSERTLKAKITQLEDMETRLRSALRPERRSSESYRKASDLVQELIDAEARECRLKEQIRSLEASVNQFELNIKDMDQCKQRLENELRDHDELVSTLVTLQQQIQSLKNDLNKSLQSQDSLQEMLKDAEKYCLQRDEEMHDKYKMLEDEKCNMEITIQQLKHRLRNNQNDKYSEECEANSNSKTTQSIATDHKQVNDEKTELYDARMNMEKCIKRAMVVVQMEMKQKDKTNHNIPLIESEELESLDLFSCSYPSDNSDNDSIVNSQTLIDNFSEITS